MASSFSPQKEFRESHQHKQLIEKTAVKRFAVKGGCNEP
jgi:hypothetical protein